MSKITQITDGMSGFEARTNINEALKNVEEGDITLSDVTTRNVTTAQHGFMSKLPGSSSVFYRGDGTFGLPSAGVATNGYIAQSFTGQTSVTVTHNFGSIPCVSILDGSQNVMIPFTVNHAVDSMSVTITFSEATSGLIVLNLGSQDFSQIRETRTAGENLVSGNLCYLKSDGKYWKTNASAEATASTKLLIALDTISADASGIFLREGEYTTTGLTAGSNYFISAATAGAFTATAPTGTGKIIRTIGTAESTTKLFFNPDQSFFELV